MWHSKSLNGIETLTKEIDETCLEKTLSAKNIRIEYPNNRTYGECILDEIASITMINGEFKATLHIKDKPKRLNHNGALKHYTQKLRYIWKKIGYSR
jgi:hypothetical protein